MSEFELQAQPRETRGKAHSRRMRRLDNTIPAVIYGAGKDAAHITLDHNKVIKALENEAFYSHILTVKTDGKGEKVILKDLQRHPYKSTVLHMDFLRIKANQKLTMHVPVHFTNEEQAPGVKNGGVVTHHQSDIEVSCLPADLPEFIEVDLTNLELDGSIHLSAVKLPKGVESVALALGEDHDFSVVSIHEPRVEAEPEPEATEEETAEGETAAEGSEGEASAEKPAEGEDKKPAE